MPTIRELIDAAKREEWLTVNQYSLLMQVSIWQVYRAVRAGQIPAQKIGHSLRVQKPHPEQRPRYAARGDAWVELP